MARTRRNALTNEQQAYNLLFGFIEKNDFNSFKELLDQNHVSANVTSPHSDNISLLHIAAYFGNADIVKALIEKGAKLEEKDWNSFSVSDYARGGKNPQVITKIINEAIEVNPNDVNLEIER
jgi:ankyrin repeat protein